MRATKQARRTAKQLFRLSHIDGILDEGRAQHLVQRFLKEKPRGCLAVLVEFQRLLKIEHAQREAMVESATPLSAEESAQVRPSLEQT